jgi:biopolymer transport protein ExbD
VGDGIVEIEDTFIPFLRKTLREDPDILVILRVDRGAPYSTLTELITKCKKAGATNISIGTEQKKVNG